MKKGTHHTNRAKEKIRLFRIGKSSGMLGKHHSKKSKIKMSISTAGDNNPMKRPEVRAKFVGENNPSKRPEVRKKISNAKRGKKHSKEHKRKNSEAHKGMCLSEETKKKIGKSSMGRKHSKKDREQMSLMKMGKNNPMYGKHWTKEHRENQSKARSGKGNPNWQGGIGKFPYSFNFDDELKKLIRKRDNYTCQLCNEKQNDRKLSVHHIDYNKENSDPNNLIALCRACNTKVNYKRRLWKKFFQRKLKLLA